MSKPPDQANRELKEVREQQAVLRSQRMRMWGRLIPASSFRIRKELFAAKV